MQQLSVLLVLILPVASIHFLKYYEAMPVEMGEADFVKIEFHLVDTHKIYCYKLLMLCQKRG